MDEEYYQCLAHIEEVGLDGLPEKARLRVESALVLRVVSGLVPDALSGGSKNNSSSL